MLGVSVTMMSPMDKAKAAMMAAKEVLDSADFDEKGLLSLVAAEDFSRLMRVAEVQTLIALAESVERLAAKHGV